MIEIRNLQKRFGDVTAVDGISFSAADGAITGTLGENGAGKTTTLAMIGGLRAPDSGSIQIDGIACGSSDVRGRGYGSGDLRPDRLGHAGGRLCQADRSRGKAIMTASLIVARKEIRDHVRDTRSVASTALYALMGPVVVKLVSFSRAAEGTGGPRVLLSMASVFALVAAFAGGMNVAMDSMAGERERRSLVPLLLTPVPRSDLVIGKWIAANVFGVVSVGLTVTGFGLLLTWGASQSLQALAAQLVVWVLCGLIPLALLGSAVHLLVAANSRTTKEAHSWLSMTVFVPMLVGMFMVFFPGWTDGWRFVAPIAGQQSLIARILEGQPVSLLHGVVLAALTLAAAVPPLLATRGVLNRHDVLVG
jgi:ABC-type Na+ efflux pump permease subunit